MKKKTRTVTVLLMTLCMVFAMAGTVFAGTALTSRDAAAKALRDAGLTRAKACGLEVESSDRGRTFDVEFTRRSDGTDYEYEIRKSDGLILEKEVEYAHRYNASSKKIGEAAAFRKAASFSGKSLAVVKSGTIRLTRSDGEYVYVIKFRQGRWHYECKILAPTGKVIEWSKKYR